MTRLVPLLALALAGCGPQLAPGPGFDIELVVNRGLLDQVSAFQVSLVTKGTTAVPDCVAAQKLCIKDQVDAARFVMLKDASGVSRKAIVAPINLKTGMPNTQDLTLQELPLGKDFALVVEALSKESPPRLAGSSCTYVKELTAGTNPTAVAKIELLTPPVMCDPRLQ